jgi:hypothetical protein
VAVIIEFEGSFFIARWIGNFESQFPSHFFAGNLVFVKETSRSVQYAVINWDRRFCDEFLGIFEESVCDLKGKTVVTLLQNVVYAVSPVSIPRVWIIGDFDYLAVSSSPFLSCTMIFDHLSTSGSIASS